MWIIRGIFSSLSRLFWSVMLLGIFIVRVGKPDLLRLKVMVSKDNVSSMLLVCTIVTLGFVAFQTCSLSNQTEMLRQQTSILQADFEARSRPYLVIEDIQIEDKTTVEGKILDVKTQVRLDVKNYGTLPATDIRLASIEFSPLLEPTPTPELTCFTQEDGIEICVALGYGLPHLYAPMSDIYDKILYPARVLHVDLLIEGSSIMHFQDFAKNGKMIIILNYSSGDKSYSYSAEVTQLDGIWQVTSEKQT